METFLLVSNIVLWVVVLGLGFLLLGVLRALGLLSWQLDQLYAITPRKIDREGLKPGSKAPDFALPSAAGGEVALHDYLGRKVLLVFTQAGCGPCHAVAPELNRLQRKGEVQVLVVNNGDAVATRQWAGEVQALFPVLSQEHFSLSKRFRVYATPFGFLIDAAGVIASKGIVSTRQYLGYVLSGRGVATNGHVETEQPGPEKGDSGAVVRDSPQEARRD